MTWRYAEINDNDVLTYVIKKTETGSTATTNMDQTASEKLADNKLNIITTVIITVAVLVIVLIN